MKKLIATVVASTVAVEAAIGAAYFYLMGYTYHLASFISPDLMDAVNQFGMFAYMQGAKSCLGS